MNADAMIYFWLLVSSPFIEAIGGSVIGFMLFFSLFYIFRYSLKKEVSS